ncbi:MAG: hypothetical protein AB7O96_04135 [Pseudobdellovibrionaceae bacterium]
MARLKSIGIFLIIFAIGGGAHAGLEHSLLRRISVFPLQARDLEPKLKEEVWWKVRETLAGNQKFLVATRRFMINRDVFQARLTLEPADAIILGKILDAQAVMTMFLTEKTLNVFVYDGGQGFLIWKGALTLHPALPIKEQIVSASEKITKDFINSFPYQGSQVGDKKIVDNLIQARVFVGAGAKILENEPAQWISVEAVPGGELFSDSSRFTVIAEGVVTRVSGEHVDVNVTSVRNDTDIRDKSLVRFPKELERLQSTTQGLERQSENLERAKLQEAEARPGEQNSTTTSLAWILGVAAFILIAF